jgi:prolyl oligopeptidase
MTTATLNGVPPAPSPADGAHDQATAAADPNAWMEDLRGERIMAWVREASARSAGELQQHSIYRDVRQKVLEVLNSTERIPAIAKYGSHVYNFWRDARNPRGLWRRTSLDEYRKPQPAWEIVIDLDALAAAEKENWVWSGADILELPQGDPKRALVQLSRGGGDAHVVREFDLTRKTFVSDGFTLPEAKHRIAWADENTLLVGTDYGPGSLTTSGYPRIIKEWKRATPLADARSIFEGEVSDMSVSVAGYLDHGLYRIMLNRSITFFSGHEFLRQGSEWRKIDKPDDADASTFGNKILLRLRTDWTLDGKTYKGGSLLARDMNANQPISTLFEPTERSALASFSRTKSFLILNTMENVASKVYFAREETPGSWRKSALETAPFVTVSARGLDPEHSDELLIDTSGFLIPSTLALGNAANPNTRETLKQLPAFFDATGMDVQQFEATSPDGTKIPYFQVARKGLVSDASNPTLLYGYGGFQISMRPSYLAEIGRAWLQSGGVYVVANIRGGGEFGPAWHFAARKEHRQRAYDDFAAVAEDLHRRKITSPAKLGIMGRSNGGLLTGVMLTQRPELFGAVVIGSPLLDMQRYIYLPAGASWIDEYGDPSRPDEWAYIARYSPYNNVKSGVKYPLVMITTSTLDDRVHPGHARKFAAKLMEAGHPVRYYENTEGGHSAAANNEQRAHILALEYAFLWHVLGKKQD